VAALAETMTSAPPVTSVTDAGGASALEASAAVAAGAAVAPVAAVARPRRARGLIWRVAAQAGPHLFIAAVVPSVCFVVGRDLWGLGGAVGLALGWNAACQTIRWRRGRPWSGLLVIGSVSLVLKATVALAMNSAQMFFLAPAVVTVLIGGIYIGSAFGPTPLVNRVVADLVPRSILDVEDPCVRTLLRIGSVIYGVEQMVAAVVSIIMVVHLSTTTYVALHELVSFAIFGLVVAIAVPCLLGQVRTAMSLRAVQA
jgi:intracellular septation protein A